MNKRGKCLQVPGGPSQPDTDPGKLGQVVEGLKFVLEFSGHAGSED